MKTIKSIITLLVLTLLVTGCKKEEILQPIDSISSKLLIAEKCICVDFDEAVKILGSEGYEQIASTYDPDSCGSRVARFEKRYKDVIITVKLYDAIPNNSYCVYWGLVPRFDGYIYDDKSDFQSILNFFGEKYKFPCGIESSFNYCKYEEEEINDYQEMMDNLDEIFSYPYSEYFWNSIEGVKPHKVLITIDNTGAHKHYLAVDLMTKKPE